MIYAINSVSLDSFVVHNMFVNVDKIFLFRCNSRNENLTIVIFCSLDTFPYAGTTTTCESLYMGVPCVTMGGTVHAHNVGVSLLTTVGTYLFSTCAIK